ncbi:hypothetical protein [Streptomyces sp. NPDC050704]|uniref:hypothetical protein n=1 Tax=Streptomyces sp. NPDC050704 TaxID=3157219 RepID=UPI0034332772
MRDPRSALAETLNRIDSHLGDGRGRDDVLDVAQLSIATGVPQDVVTALLEGKEPPAEDITDRIICRIVHFRETRRRADGDRYSYEEIAKSYGATRASLSNLVNSRKKTTTVTRTGTAQGAERRGARAGGPLASTQAGIERFFFGEPNGRLSAEPESALNDALQPILRDLELQAEADENPLAKLRTHHGLRRIAARAPQLSEEEREMVADWIDTILQRRKGQGSHASDPGTSRDPLSDDST